MTNWKIIGRIGAVACIVIWVAIWYVSSLIGKPHLPPASAVNADSANPPPAKQAETNDDYKIGERLPRPSTAAKAGSLPDSTQTRYREITWDDLIPRDWDPMALFKGINLERLNDNDPRAIEVLAKAKEYWKRAPPEQKMNGEAIRIPGFVVSLDREGDALKEFLLVPYFGGCIHVPPPPANQIVHVHSVKAVRGVRTMDAVWISGVLEVRRSETGMGMAGYVMTADKIELYRPPLSAGK